MPIVTEEVSTYKRGNTIRLTAKFFDWDQETPIDPTLVRFKLYDRYYAKLLDISIGPANRVVTGEYFHHFIPDTVGEFIYEFEGDIDGLPTLDRKRIKVVEV